MKTNGSITVANKYKLSGDLTLDSIDIYIGRPSALGNPYPMKDKSDRPRVIELYRQWLWKQIQLKNRSYQELVRITNLVNSGKNIRLICYCAPLPCHGDVIVRAVQWLIDSGYDTASALPQTHANDQEVPLAQS